MAEIMDQGVRKLAVSVGNRAPGRALSRLTALRGSPGWKAAENAVEEWRFDGVVEKDGELYLHGPHVAGRSLESVLSLGLAEALPYMARLASGLALLRERSIPLFPIQTDSVIFPEDGGVLLLPPEIFRELRGLRGTEENVRSFEKINHPDLSGEKLASFSLAALLYRLSTGRFPFDGGAPEQVHEQARRLSLQAPDRLVPGLSAELSRLIMAGLGRAKEQEADLAVWKEKTGEWISVSLVSELPPEERERILQEAAVEEAKAGKRFRRAAFVEKYWVRGVVIAAAVALAGVLAGRFIGNLLAPRATHGFTAEKVVETFYNAMNTLDHTLMSACVTGGAGSEDITATTNIFVMSRAALAYEGRSSIANAAEWDAAGRPELQPMVSVYGVTGLSVTPESAGSEAVFTARYVKWMPLSRDVSPDPRAPLPAGPYYEGKNVTERVYLKQDKGDWVIHKIERLQEEPLT